MSAATTTPRRLLLAPLVVLLALTAGCGSGDTATGPGPTPTQVSPEGESPSATAEVATRPPTGSPAATGPVVTSSIVTVHAPADWVDEPTSTDLGGNVSGPTVEYNLALSDSESSSPDDSIDYLAKIAQDASLYTPPLQRGDDVVVAGQPAYQMSGNDSLFGGWAEEYSIRYQGHDIFITISTPRDLPQAERDALSASILASVELAG